MPYSIRGQRFSQSCQLSCCWRWSPSALRRWCAAGWRCRCWCWRACPWCSPPRWPPAPDWPSCMLRSTRSARPGRAARRAEVGRLGDARLRPGRRRCGADVTTLVAARGGRGGVLRRAGAVTSRLGLGRSGKGRVGALSDRLGDRCDGDQSRPRRGRGVAGRHHAALRLVRAGTGAGSAAAVAARRRAEHRRPDDFGQQLFSAKATTPALFSGCCWQVLSRRPFGTRAWDGWWSSWARPATWVRLQRHWNVCRSAYRGRDLALYRVGGATAGASAGQRRTAVIAHLAWLVLLVGGAAGLAWRQRAGAHSGERPR